MDNSVTSSPIDGGERYLYVTDHSRSRHYCSRSRVMVIFSLAIFTLIFLIFILYVYIRCRRSINAHPHRNVPLFFYNEAIRIPSSINVLRGGLDPSIINSLPVFVYSGPSPMECSVCLSEFRQGEKGKKLPECSHSFHVGCIDAWFCSHSTCPLCRSNVVLARKEEPDEKKVAATGSVPDASSSSSSTTMTKTDVKDGGGRDLEIGDVSRIDDR